MDKKILIIMFILLNFSISTQAELRQEEIPRDTQLNIKTSIPAPFGFFQKLEVKDYLKIRPRTNLIAGQNCLDTEYAQIFFDANKETHYFCSKIAPDKYELRRLGHGLWEKTAENENYNIYPYDITEADSLYLVGIGTTDPQAKLHIISQGSEDGKTSIRLDENTDEDSSWEISTHNILGARSKVFSITGGLPPFGDDSGLFITQQGSVYLADNFSGINAEIQGYPDPKLNVQKQADALTPPNIFPRLVNVNHLAAAFTNNSYSNESVGIGFGVDFNSPLNPPKPQQYGGAIVFEREGVFSTGKLHFATKPAGMEDTERYLPIRMTIDKDGRVGIGTQRPQFQLHITGNNNQKNGGILATGAFGEGEEQLGNAIHDSNFIWHPKKAALRAGYIDSGNNYWDDNNIGKYSIAMGKNTLANEEFTTVSGGSNNTAIQRGATVSGGIGNSAEGPGAVVSGGLGNKALGIGAVIPGGTKNETGGVNSFVSGVNMRLSSYANNTFLWGHSDVPIDPIETPDAFIIYSGNVGIGEIAPEYKLDVAGVIRASGFIDESKGTMFIPINKGGRNDIAELFETTEEVETGDLLVIDNNEHMKLKKSHQPYEKGIIGIVSESPAILFEGKRTQISPDPQGIKNATKPPLALAGRVPCKVTDENGTIEVGDLLTSSSIPGHAMKATDREKSFGTIIGKALEPFPNNKDSNGPSTGTIMVFVHMQ